MEKIGLIPAAGNASRMQPLPCSKEILPLPPEQKGTGGQIAVVSENLLLRLINAGCGHVFWVLQPSKLDIITYYSKKVYQQPAMAYMVIDDSEGVPFTLDFAYPFVRDKIVMMGFGDICLGPLDAFNQAERTLHKTGADVALGLFPIHDPDTRQRSDMVEITSGQKISKIQVKPSKTDLSLSWALAVWRPSFTDFMHRKLQRLPKKDGSVSRAEIHLGNIFQQAIEDGLTLVGHSFDHDTFLDLGTPESWYAATVRGVTPWGAKKHGPGGQSVQEPQK